MQFRSTKLTAIADAGMRILASEYCFYAIIVFFVVQALWFAFSARYPMAFDENFHFGLIQLHATQWLPFFTHQPINADAYSDVSRDPSYFYHFLMSIPYRAIRLATSNTSAQIIALRLINIALFTSALCMYRRLLLKLGGSRQLAHMSLLIFSLVPIVPFLAAQINYDNLLILLVVGALLFLTTWLERLAHHEVSFVRSLLFYSLLLMACIVKYAFLPILATFTLVIGYEIWRQRRYWPVIRANFAKSIIATPVAVMISVLVIASTATGLFGERYAVNLWRYHNPVPDCSQVLTVQQCSQYSPWARNYNNQQGKPGAFKPSLLQYVHSWFAGMWQRSFFAISDTYANIPPLPIPGHTVIILAIIGGALLLRFGRKVFHGSPIRVYVILTFLIYTLALFLDTYSSYVQTGATVALNGRYLIPFLPIVFFFIGRGFSYVFKRHQELKLSTVVVVTILLLQGGGVLTFIVQSNQTWDWQSSPVIHVNNAARDIIRPLIIGSHRS